MRKANTTLSTESIPIISHSRFKKTSYDDYPSGVRCGCPEVMREREEQLRRAAEVSTISGLEPNLPLVPVWNQGIPVRRSVNKPRGNQEL
jgi:hypothetical protein